MQAMVAYHHVLNGAESQRWFTLCLAYQLCCYTCRPWARDCRARYDVLSARYELLAKNEAPKQCLPISSIAVAAT